MIAYHGWAVVAACFMVAVFGWGLGFYGLGVYLAVLPSAHGWSPTLVSAATTVYYLAGAVLVAFVPDLLARIGPRRLFLAGMASMAIGTSTIAIAAAPWQLFGGYLVMACGWASMSMTAISTTLAPWFERRRGLAISIALTGASVGGVVVAPLMLLVAERHSLGWGVAAALGLMLVLLLPLVVRYVRRHPAEVGQEVDGGAATPDGATQPPPTGRRSLSDRAAMLRDPHFWSVAAPFALALTAQVGFLAHQVRMIEAAADTATAALGVALTTLAAVCGRLVLGSVIDRHDPRWLAMFTFGSQALALFLLIGAADPMVLVGASILFGFSVGNLITLPALVIQREFDAVSFGRVFGLSVAIGQGCYAFGPTLLGVVAERTGRYDGALVACVGIDLVAMAWIVAGRTRLARVRRTP